MPQTTGVINGTNLRLYVGGNVIAYATNFTLTGSRELIELIHKDNPGAGWREVKPGRGQWDATIEALYNEDGANNTPIDLFDIFNNKTEISGFFSTENEGDTRLSFSAAYITSLEINAPVEENASYSAQIAISGAITKATIT